jgi:tRNA-binding protein
MITWDDFEKIEMRIGTIIEAEVFAKAKRPAYKLKVDFGEFGVKQSSAQITSHYQPEELIGKQVMAVVNFPPKQIANFISECLVMGVYDSEGNVVLLHPGKIVANGCKIG